MISSLGLCLTVAGLLVAAGATVIAVLDRPVPIPLKVAVGVVELAAVAQALAAIIDLLDGHKLSEPTVTYAYLLTSIGLLPIATTSYEDQEGRWPAAAIAVCAVIFVVVNIRLHSTW